MKKIIKNCIVIMMLCSTIISCGNSKTKASYVDGIIESGKTIEDYYKLSGETKVLGCVSGGQNSYVVPINVSEVEGGGYVAWKDDYYSYSKDEIGMTVASHLAISKFGVKGLE